jgi:hypothetical protein
MFTSRYRYFVVFQITEMRKQREAAKSSEKPDVLHQSIKNFEKHDLPFLFEVVSTAMQLLSRLPRSIDTAIRIFTVNLLHTAP